MSHASLGSAGDCIALVSRKRYRFFGEGIKEMSAQLIVETIREKRRIQRVVSI